MVRVVHLGDEVRDRDIDLVADGTDHRNRRSGDRAREHLLVERPQVLRRAAAPSDDDDVRETAVADRAQCAGEVAGGVLALHPRGREQHARPGRPRLDHVQDVRQRRTHG